MKSYLASYVNGKDECWDLKIVAKSYKDALKEARRQQAGFGKLYHLGIIR